MHAYAWYVWRNTPRSGPSLKVRIGKSETIAALSAVNLPTRLTAETKLFGLQTCAAGLLARLILDRYPNSTSRRMTSL